jgi:hypothetical protein
MSEETHLSRAMNRRRQRRKRIMLALVLVCSLAIGLVLGAVLNPGGYQPSTSGSPTSAASTAP